jgi:antitoxin HigA-1
MSIPNTGKRTRRPTHPGEMLREEYLLGYDMSVAGLAKAIRVSRQTVNELINERRALSPEMAMRLSRLFGNSPEYWLNLQRAVDLFDAELALREELAAITPLELPDEAA